MQCQRRATRIAMCSRGRAESDCRITHPRSYLLHAIHKRRISRSTSEPGHVRKNKNRAQPLSKWSDGCTQSVGCFRTGCHGWLSSGNDANVCFAHGHACAPGVADIDMTAQALQAALHQVVIREGKPCFSPERPLPMPR